MYSKTFKLLNRNVNAHDARIETNKMRVLVTSCIPSSHRQIFIWTFQLQTIFKYALSYNAMVHFVGNRYCILCFDFIFVFATSKKLKIQLSASANVCECNTTWNQCGSIEQHEFQLICIFIVYFGVVVRKKKRKITKINTEKKIREKKKENTATVLSYSESKWCFALLNWRL